MATIYVKRGIVFAGLIALLLFASPRSTLAQAAADQPDPAVASEFLAQMKQAAGQNAADLAELRAVLILTRRALATAQAELDKAKHREASPTAPAAPSKPE